jgi:hypothetical protein
MSRVDDEVVLLDADSSVYYGLNAVGSRMLELLTESRNLETAIHLAEGEFDASEECIRKDLFALLNVMIEKGLVKEYAV